jgi:large subunit ribosomal protein L25
MEITLRELKVSCLPRYIPEDIPLDIHDVKIGDAIYVKDIKVDNINIREAGNIPIVSVHAARTGKAETTETTESAEPTTEKPA